MSNESYNFHGQTTFINKPINTVISDFQKEYVTGADGSEQGLLRSLQQIVELLLSSADLPDRDKEEAVAAVHAVARQVKDKSGSRFTVQGTLEALNSLVGKAADIATPAMALIATALKLAGGAA